MIGWMKGCSTLLLAFVLVVTAGVGVVWVGSWRGDGAGQQVVVAPLLTPASTSAPDLTAQVAASQATQIDAGTDAETDAAANAETDAETDTGAMPTVEPTAAPSPMPLPTPTAAAPLLSYAPAQPAVLLTGIRHEWQTWNNCGPATLAMNMSYFGDSLKQADIGAVLRTSPDDKNVSPHELVDFARAQGYHATELVNGDSDLLRTLLSNGFPVLLETWYEREPGDGIGHYRLLVGYNDATQAWTIFDSLDSTGLVTAEPYAGIRMSYSQLANLWKVFNRAFVLLYPSEKAALAEAILADHGLAVDRMWADAEARARAEVAGDEGDLFAWFNLGSSLTHQGRTAEAAAAFDRAREIGLPKRMLWYQFTPFDAYLAEGRQQDIMALTDAILEETESIEEVFYWRARALLALGDVVGARSAVQQSLVLAPGFQPSVELNTLMENG